MKTNSRDIAVIVKLIQDTRQKKLICIYNRLLLNILQLISQKYGRNF